MDVMGRRLDGRRLLDLLLVLAGLALTGLAVKAHWAVLPPPVIGIAGAVGSLAQAGRRRWPVPAAAPGWPRSRSPATPCRRWSACTRVVRSPRAGTSGYPW